MAHLTYIEGYEGHKEELAVRKINQRYDALAEDYYLEALKVLRDSDADLARGNPQLSAALYRAYEALLDVKDEINEAWRLSKPHMKLEEE